MTFSLLEFNSDLYLISRQPGDADCMARCGWEANMDLLLRVSVELDNEGLPKKLSGQLPAGLLEERIVARFVSEHG